MKKYLPILKTEPFSKGFTLTELLVAMSLTVVVLTLAGSGLVSIMNANQKAELETERRTNLNRALDFIADEIRTAKSVTSIPSGFSFAQGSTTVALLVTLPATSPSSNPPRIVYFINPSTTNWAVPYTIRRYELPSTYSSGIISVPSDADSSVNMLVDGIMPPTTTLPTCMTNGGLKGANGFYACISDDNRTVDLYLYGKLSNTNSTTYEAKTRVFARSN